MEIMAVLLSLYHYNAIVLYVFDLMSHVVERERERERESSEAVCSLLCQMKTLGAVRGAECIFSNWRLYVCSTAGNGPPIPLIYIKLHSFI